MKRPLSDALVAAQAVVDLLAPGCERIEVAGSIRRRAAEVKDIEIVAVPRYYGGMFGALHDDLLNDTIGSALRSLRLACRNTVTGEKLSAAYKMSDRRFYPLFFYPAIGRWPVDLFVVRGDAQWGALMAIRTGPADYSKKLVTTCRKRGLHCTEGRLVDSEGRTVDTPEEEDFIRECGLPFLPPEQRR